MRRMLAALLVGCFLAAPSFGAGASIRVESLTGGDVDPLVAPAGTKAIVFLFTSTDCPVSNRYAPEVQRIAAIYGPQGVSFRLIYPNPSEKTAAIREHMTAFAYQGAADAFRDPRHALVGFVGATITPEVAVVVDRRVVYRGRIDDRFVGRGVARPAPTRHDLADALLAAALTGRPIVPATTQPVGCYISDFTR